LNLGSQSPNKAIDDIDAYTVIIARKEGRKLIEKEGTTVFFCVILYKL